jgi:16S rRNA (cytosine967-C5)-methyltransferase
MPISPARVAAFAILTRIESADAYASELLHSSRFAKFSLADHGLLTEIAMGVLRWRSMLDEAIASHSSQPLAKLDLEVLTALRIAAYQLLFLDRIPAHAAIDDSVELTKRAGKRSAAGFVNAVLRKITKEKAQPGSLDPRLAHPQWLVERWTRHFGVHTAQRICAYDQTAPSPRLRINDSAVVKELLRNGVELQPGRLVSNSFMVTAGDITQTSAFRERRAALQDEASQLLALLVGSGSAILDCCAAPGGKTRILAERNPNARVVAMELHPRRAALLKKLVPESNVRVIAADIRSTSLTEPFDRVLVDAPCSGTGTLARNPEIKWRLKTEDLGRLQIYQAEILSAAMNQVAPGGRLVYSTCSLEPEENEQVIEKVLASGETFAVVDCGRELEKLKASAELVWDNVQSLLSGPYLRTIPGLHPCDGFFAAILERRS